MGRAVYAGATCCPLLIPWSRHLYRHYTWCWAAGSSGTPPVRRLARVRTDQSLTESSGRLCWYTIRINLNSPIILRNFRWRTPKWVTRNNWEHLTFMDRGSCREGGISWTDEWLINGSRISEPNEYRHIIRLGEDEHHLTGYTNFCNFKKIPIINTRQV